MTTYTKIAKPSGTNYTQVNPMGREGFDDANILFDDPNVFFDGYNVSQYTKINKPSGTTYTNIPKPS